MMAALLMTRTLAQIWRSSRSSFILRTLTHQIEVEFFFHGQMVDNVKGILFKKECYWQAVQKRQTKICLIYFWVKPSTIQLMYWHPHRPIMVMFRLFGTYSNSIEPNTKLNLIIILIIMVWTDGSESQKNYINLSTIWLTKSLESCLLSPTQNVKIAFWKENISCFAPNEHCVAYNQTDVTWCHVGDNYFVTSTWLDVAQKSKQNICLGLQCNFMFGIPDWPNKPFLSLNLSMIHCPTATNTWFQLIWL